jgi:hypothetical protein
MGRCKEPIPTPTLPLKGRELYHPRVRRSPFSL